MASSGIINKALRLLGVSPGEGDVDEFGALSLRRFRDNAGIIRTFLLADWVHAWFVLAEADLPELLCRADRHAKFSIRRAESGLYSCPELPDGSNFAEDFLMEKSAATHDFALSKEELWWTNSFFKNVRGVPLLPSKRHPAAQRLAKQTSVAFQIWSAAQAEKTGTLMKADGTVQNEFADFKSKIYHTTPPQTVITKFTAILEFLSSFFSDIKPGFVGILVDP